MATHTGVGLTQSTQMQVPQPQRGMEHTPSDPMQGNADEPQNSAQLSEEDQQRLIALVRNYKSQWSQDRVVLMQRCLQNLQAVCDAAGTTLDRAVRLTIYMTDLGAFAEVNEVYASFFAEDPPARVAVGVAQLPRGAYVEIDATVAL